MDALAKLNRAIEYNPAVPDYLILRYVRSTGNHAE